MFQKRSFLTKYQKTLKAFLTISNKKCFVYEINCVEIPTELDTLSECKTLRGHAKENFNNFSHKRKAFDSVSFSFLKVFAKIGTFLR